MGPGFCPVFLRPATSRVRCLPLLKGEKNSLVGDNCKFSESVPHSGFFCALGLLLQRKKIPQHSGNTALTVAHIPSRCILFLKCIFSYKAKKVRHGNDFSDCISVPQKKQNSIFVTLPMQLCDRLICGKVRLPQHFPRLATHATHFGQKAASRMRSAFSRYKKITRFCLVPTRKGRVFCWAPGSINPSSAKAFSRLLEEQEKLSP